MKNQYILINVFAIILLVILPFGLASYDDPDLQYPDYDGSSSSNNVTDTLGSDGVPSSITTTTPIPTEISVTVSESPTTAAPTIINGTGIVTTTPTEFPITTNLSTTTTTESSATSPPITGAPTTPPPITEAPTTPPTITEAPTTPSSTTETSTISTIVTESSTTAAPGRKFDGLSFVGGMILVVGLGALGYLVIRYLRRGSRLPYSNLR